MVQKNTGSESCGGGVQINHTWPVAYVIYRDKDKPVFARQSAGPRVRGAASASPSQLAYCYIHRTKYRKLICRREAARCFMFVCSQLQHTYNIPTAQFF